jgi:Protein of unknown function (DUF3352)
VTFKDPNEPLGADSPTEAYRVPATPPAAPYENGVSTPAPTSPAVPPPTKGRPSRVRWAVAVAVVALVVVASGVAAALLTGSAPNAKILAWAPADSIVYGEFRLDLPGDQRQNVAEFLSHFPGFDDQAAIDTKLDETLDQFLTSATSGDQSYIADVEPWFGGEVGFVASDLPNPGASVDPESLDTGSAAVLLSVKDAALAQAWFDGAVSDANPTTEDYEGVTLTVLSAPEGSLDGSYGYAVTGDVAVLGEVGAVKNVLDTKGASPLTSDAAFAAALNSGSGDHIGFVYYDFEAYWDWAMGLAAENGGDVEVGAMPATAVAETFRDTLPAWGALWARVEGDALSFQVSSAPPEQRLGATENRASTLASRAPGTTIAYGETHDYGKVITDMLGMYDGVEIPEEATQQLEQVMGVFGGVEGLVGWIGDVAFVVNDPGEGFEGGLLIQPTDATKAENLFLTIRGMLSLGGASLGLSVSDEQHGDATITTVDFGGLRELLAQGGETVPPEALEYFGGADARLQLSWTVTDDLVVIGLGPDFVRHVLDTEPGTSLAQSDRFESLLARTGAENTGQWFVDVAAIRLALEEATPDAPEMLQKYEREIKPFLEPFDALVGSTVIGGSNPDKATFLTTVK